MIFPFCVIEVMGFNAIIHKKGFGVNRDFILTLETISMKIVNSTF